jgi:hypothetical protein
MSEDFKMDTYFGFMQHSRSAEHGLMKACAEVERLTARLALAEAVCWALVHQPDYAGEVTRRNIDNQLTAWRNSQATPPGQEGAGK